VNGASFRISVRDFGFVVARALALFAWFQAAMYTVAYLGTLVGVFSTRGRGPTPLELTLTLAAGVGVLALVFAGQRLWVEAPRFGGSGDTDGDAAITLSRIALLQGFTAAMGIYCAVRALIHLEPFALSIVAPGPEYKLPSSPGSSLYYAIVYGGFAIGLISWTARAGRPADEDEG